jgi:hypothetical protein
MTFASGAISESYISRKYRILRLPRNALENELHTAWGESIFAQQKRPRGKLFFDLILYGCGAHRIIGSFGRCFRGQGVISVRYKIGSVRPAPMFSHASLGFVGVRMNSLPSLLSDEG